MAVETVRNLLLVRHGQYKRSTELSPEKLTAAGREQARYASTFLLDYDVDRVIYSTMPRAEETTALLLRHLNFKGPVIPSTNLWEGIPGFPKKLRKKYGYNDAKLLKMHKDRIDKAFDKFFKPSPRGATTDLLVCHGNVIRYLVCRAMGFAPDKWIDFEINNCGVTLIRIKGKKPLEFKLEYHNSIGHLPPALRTQT